MGDHENIKTNPTVKYFLVLILLGMEYFNTTPATPGPTLLVLLIVYLNFK